MVGVAGGSKACSTCRKRKVKCDLQMPVCGQCVKSRRQCSGPNLSNRRTTVRRQHGVPVACYGNTLDVDVLPKGSRPHKSIDHKFVIVSATTDQLKVDSNDDMTPIVHRQSPTSNATREYTLPLAISSTISSTSSSSFPTLISTPVDEITTVIVRPNDDEGPSPEAIFGDESDIMFTAPPLANVYFEGLLSSFMDHFCLMASSRFDGAFFDPWITAMPSFVASTSPALTYASRAAVVCHFSRVRPDRDLELFSMQLYSRALQHHSREISRSISLPSVNDDMISTSILLSLYEALHFTSFDAYGGLIKGCLELFALRGPHAFKTGLSAILFQSARTILTVYVLLIRVVPCFLAEPEWITIPFETMPEKPPSQTLCDILLCIPRYRRVIAMYRPLLRKRRDLSVEERMNAAAAYFGLAELQSKLNQWLIDYKKIVSGIDSDYLPDSVLYTEDYSKKCHPNATNEQWSSSHTFKPPLLFANNAVATLIPLYYTALAVILRGQRAVYDCAQEFPGTHGDLVTVPIEEFEELSTLRIARYSRLICQSVEYIAGIQRAVAILSILYPLKVAQAYLQDPLEQNWAFTWCEKLNKRFGLGISMFHEPRKGYDNGGTANSLPTCPHCGERVRAGVEKIHANPEDECKPTSAAGVRFGSPSSLLSVAYAYCSRRTRA
ncbi:hypothetical protein V1525DRAFT_396717 [Lipomyces kononenkoae]|uniref:Uncharacterized protein n=1 Tax=Lipomyces kononenkoae TaxID=34357 RepID=A0ACC3T7U2_LIPKO